MDYKWDEKNRHKYIAAAVEACLGYMYRSEEYTPEDIKDLVKEWEKHIDKR